MKNESWQQNRMKWWINKYTNCILFLIAPFINCTIMKNNHKKDWKPKIMYSLFFFFEFPLLSHFFSAFFRVVLNRRVFNHDMFHFIRHSPFLWFDKRQKLHIHTYTYTCI